MRASNCSRDKLKGRKSFPHSRDIGEAGRRHQWGLERQKDACLMSPNATTASSFEVNSARMVAPGVACLMHRSRRLARVTWAGSPPTHKHGAAAHTMPPGFGMSSCLTCSNPAPSRNDCHAWLIQKLFRQSCRLHMALLAHVILTLAATKTAWSCSNSSTLLGRKSDRPAPCNAVTWHLSVHARPGNLRTHMQASARGEPWRGEGPIKQRGDESAPSRIGSGRDVRGAPRCQQP